VVDDLYPECQTTRRVRHEERRPRPFIASGYAAILVDQAAKDVDALEPAGGRRHGHCRRRPHRNLEVDTTVRAAGVVALEIPG
jgi:hypothetical protein